MKILKKTLTIAAACLVLLAGLFSVLSEELANVTDERTQYEAFLKEHPFYKSQPKTERQSGPEEGEKKRDRPDLRMQQEFLMTMDPELKRPTPEKLPAIMAAAKNARTYGTLPGESTAPWVERGPNNVGGRTRALMWDPNDATGKKVWAAGVSGGLWFNSDITSTASSWTKVNDFWSNLAVSSIAFDPNNKQIFYVGTGEGFTAGGSSSVRGHGIWKSSDGGTTWTQLESSKDFYYVNDLVVRNANGVSELYAGVVNRYHEGIYAGDSEGLYKSVDGGASFVQVLTNVTGQNYPPGVADIEIAADGTLWVGTTSASFGEGGGSILKSTDGTTWTTAYTSGGDGRVELGVAPSASGVVYALIESDNKIFQMKRTADAGVTWVDMALPDDDDTGIEPADFTRGQAWYDLISAVDPARDSTVVIGAINLFRSTDGGQTWKQISKWSNNANMGSMPYSYVHADQHAIHFKPGSSTEVIFGNDGGVFWTNDFSDPANTDKIVARNNNYNVTQFYANAIHPDKAKSYFLAGAQDNGTQRFQAAGINATDEVSGGDGAYCFIDQTDGTNQIAAYVYNDYSFTSDNWATSSSIASDDATGHFINPADYDDENNILYSAATDGTIARFTKGATGFTRSDLTITLGTKASNLKVSPHTRTSTTLFVGTAGGRVFRITKANTSTAVTTEITGSNFPTGWVSCIEVGQDENQLLVTFSNYGVTSVWYTADGGTTWTAKEGDLPDMPVRWALFNPTNFDEVILATDMGIWGTKSVSAAAPAWAQFNNGLANVRVDMLQMRQSDYEVVAATHGRGLFSSSIFASQAVLASDFGAKNRSTQKAVAVEFIDRSKGATAWEWTFEGGTPATSTAQNPSVTYATDGAYAVTLVAKNASGGSATKTIAGYVQVGATVEEDPEEGDCPTPNIGLLHSENMADNTPDAFSKAISAGNYIYALFNGTARGMLVIYNVSSGKPVKVKEIVNESGEFVNGLIDNGTLYIVGEQGLFVYDITDPENPSLTVHHETIFDSQASVERDIDSDHIAKSGNLLFVNSYIFRLMVIDITNINSPVLRDSFSYNFGVSNEFIPITATKGLHDDDGGLRYIDFSDPSNIVVTLSSDPAYIDLAGELYSVTIDTQKRYVFVSTWSISVNNVYIVDLTTGSVVGTFNTEPHVGLGFGSDIVLLEQQKRLVVAGVESAAVLDISDYSNIKFVETIDIDGRADRAGEFLVGKGGIGEDDILFFGVSCEIKTPPAAPSELVASPFSPSEIKLEWVDNADNELGYIIEASADGSTFELLKQVTAGVTYFVATGLAEGSTQYYRVKATNDDGESDYSNVSNATTPAYTLDAPSGLEGVATTSATISLTWSDNSADETGFDVQRSLDGDQFASVGSVEEGDTTYLDLGLMGGTAYWYRIKATNDTGDSPYTDTLKIATLDSLEVPSALTLVKATGRSIELSWNDNSSRETAFVVERAQGTGPFEVLAELAADTESYTDRDVFELSDYKYRVYAINEELELSAKSDPLLVTTPEKGFSDLTITTVDAPASQSDKKITLGATVSNISADPTEDAFEVSFYLSADASLSASDSPLGSITFDILDGEADKTLSKEFDMAILPAGDYFIIAVADEAGNIEESNESNNQQTALITLTEVLSVADDLKQGVKVYPNPATTFVNIEADVVQLGAVDIRLSDLSGKVLRSMTTGTGGINRLDISGLPKGIYVLTLRKEGVQVAHRIIKQ